MTRLFVVLAAVLAAGLAGCASPAPMPPGAGQAFDPLSWFEGRTRNEGVVQPIVGDVQRLQVDGVGRRLPDGALHFEQVIRRDADVSQRTWRVTPAGPNRWTLSGTDMVGQGQGWREGSDVILSWRRRGGDLQARQELRLLADGRLINRMTLRRMGVTLARIEETIVRLDGAPAP